jgi:hypothetical protein
VSRLHRLADDVLEFGRQRAEVDLPTQASAEALDRLGRIVLVAVKPPVDDLLGTTSATTALASTVLPRNLPMLFASVPTRIGPPVVTTDSMIQPCHSALLRGSMT